MNQTQTFAVIAAALVVVLVLTFSTSIPNYQTQLSNVVNQTSLSNQVGNLTSIHLYTPTKSGDYRISVYQLNTQAAISATLSTTIYWYDNSVILNQKPAADISFSPNNTFSNGSIYVHVQANQTISFSSIVHITSGVPKYMLQITVEKLT